MERAELQLRLIQAVYRVEGVRQQGEALEQLRARCEAQLDAMAPLVIEDDRLMALLEEIRRQVRLG